LFLSANGLDVILAQLDVAAAGTVETETAGAGKVEVAVEFPAVIDTELGAAGCRLD